MEVLLEFWEKFESNLLVCKNATKLRFLIFLRLDLKLFICTYFSSLYVGVQIVNIGINVNFVYIFQLCGTASFFLGDVTFWVTAHQIPGIMLKTYLGCSQSRLEENELGNKSDQFW